MTAYGGSTGATGMALYGGSTGATSIGVFGGSTAATSVAAYGGSSGATGIATDGGSTAAAGKAEYSGSSETRAQLPPSAPLLAAAEDVAEDVAGLAEGVTGLAEEATVGAWRRPVVLNTRPREQAHELSRLLQAAGYGVLELPAIEIVPAWDARERARVIERVQAGAYAWVVLASPNAGQALLEAVGAATLARARVLCGTATARALGLDKAHTLSRFSAAAALEALRPLVVAEAAVTLDALRPTPTVAPAISPSAQPAVAPSAVSPVGLSAAAPARRAPAAPELAACAPATAESTACVLVPRAAEGRDELLDGLRALGVAVDAPVAYCTVAVPPDRLRAALAAPPSPALPRGLSPEGRGGTGHLRAKHTDAAGCNGAVPSRGRQRTQPRPWRGEAGELSEPGEGGAYKRSEPGEGGTRGEHGWDAAPADLGVAAIALCSPSAVVALRAAWPARTLNRAAIVCLGETTAAAARGAGLEVAAVAARTTMVDLVAAIQAVTAAPASSAATTTEGLRNAIAEGQDSAVTDGRHRAGAATPRSAAPEAQPSAPAAASTGADAAREEVAG